LVIVWLFLALVIVWLFLALVIVWLFLTLVIVWLFHWFACGFRGRSKGNYKLLISHCA
jgi:hypothetical protein